MTLGDELAGWLFEQDGLTENAQDDERTTRQGQRARG
jgi:hypothetical protein